jgi:hypothetical protein
MPRIYELYGNGGAVTCRSACYDRDSREVWHVAAHSVKQACYLANHGIWVKPTSEVGIVGHGNGENDGNEWLDADGKRRGCPQFRHRQMYKRAGPEEPRASRAPDSSRKTRDRNEA